MLPGNFEICSSIIKMLDISTRLEMPQQRLSLNSHNQKSNFFNKAHGRPRGNSSIQVHS